MDSWKVCKSYEKKTKDGVVKWVFGRTENMNVNKEISSKDIESKIAVKVLRIGKIEHHLN